MIQSLITVGYVVPVVVVWPCLTGWCFTWGSPYCPFPPWKKNYHDYGYDYVSHTGCIKHYLRYNTPQCALQPVLHSQGLCLRTKKKLFDLSIIESAIGEITALQLDQGGCSHESDRSTINQNEIDVRPKHQFQPFFNKLYQIIDDFIHPHFEAHVG